MIVMPPEEDEDFDDKCFYVVPLVSGIKILTVISIVLGTIALHTCLSLMYSDPVYAIVLLGMIIPNVIGDYHLVNWILADNPNTRDMLISGVSLNLIGVAG